jgi:hypothetical protein
LADEAFEARLRKELQSAQELAQRQKTTKEAAEAADKKLVEDIRQHLASRFIAAQGVGQFSKFDLENLGDSPEPTPVIFWEDGDPPRGVAISLNEAGTEITWSWVEGSPPALVGDVKTTEVDGRSIFDFIDALILSILDQNAWGRGVRPNPEPRVPTRRMRHPDNE